MPDENTPKLIPKGALTENQAAQEHLGKSSVIVNDSASEEVKAAKAAVAQNRDYRAKMEELTKRYQQVVKENGELKKLAENAVNLQNERNDAVKALETFTAQGEGAINRQERKFSLLGAILTGLASNGQIFGNSVQKDNLTKVLTHAVGVADVAEDMALKKGF